MGNQAVALRPEVVNDLKDTTAFTADEIRTYYKAFMKECPDGRMTLPEEQFKKLYTEVFPNGDSSKFAASVFKNFDRDASGRLDFREFLTAVSIQLHGNYQEKLEWSFDLFDIDNNGYISQAELLDMVEAIYKLKSGAMPAEEKVTPAELVTHVFKKADKDHDSRLTKQEFLEMAVTSKTLHRMMVGSLAASSSPFTKRKVQAKK